MKIEDIKVGHFYLIDSAPLIASPQATGSCFEGEVLHINLDRAYVAPQNGSPLYISPHWFLKENK